MIETIILAVVIAVVVGLLLMLLGRLIASSGGGVPILATLGGFLTQFCWVIGLLVGLLYFFTGGHWRL